MLDLLDAEGLGEADVEMCGVVDQHVDAALLALHEISCGLRRLAGQDVELERAEVDVAIARELADLVGVRTVARVQSAHRGVDGVPREGQRAGGQPAHAGTGSGNDDHV